MPKRTGARLNNLSMPVKAVFAVALILILPLILMRHALVTEKAAATKDCHRILEAIDQYTADRRIPPKSAQDLVDAGYVRSVPSGEPCRIVW